MKKLGYTWYPKDWLTSDGVFELTSSQRAVYREVIDMAMLNDNNVKMNIKSWARRFNSNINEIEEILEVLKQLELITIDNDVLFIPSCENRLNMIRGARKGGLKSKPTIKPTPKQKKVKKKEKKYREFKHLSITENDYNKLLKDYTKKQIDNTLDSIENYKKNTNYNSLYLTALKWLKRDNQQNDTEAKLSQAPKPLN